MKFPNAAKGIRKIYLAEILSIAAAVLGIIILEVFALNQVGMNNSGAALKETLEGVGLYVPFMLYGAAAIVLFIVSFVLNAAGIAQAARDEAAFKRALLALVLSVVAAGVISVVQNTNRQVANWLNIAATFCTLTVFLMVIGGICALADKVGDKAVAALGEKTRKYLWCTFLLSAAAETVVALFPGDAGLSNQFGVVANVLDIVAYILYIRLLAKARLML